MTNVKVADGIHQKVDGGTRLVSLDCHRLAHGDCRGCVQARVASGPWRRCTCRYCPCHPLLLERLPAQVAPAAGLLRIVVDAPAELLTMNTARSRIHWSKWADLTRAWRDKTAERARALEIPPLIGKVGIDGRPRPSSGGSSPTPARTCHASRRALTGSRDANVLEGR